MDAIWAWEQQLRSGHHRGAEGRVCQTSHLCTENCLVLDCLTWANEGAVAERAKLLVLSNNGYNYTHTGIKWLDVPSLLSLSCGE